MHSEFLGEQSLDTFDVVHVGCSGVLRGFWYTITCSKSPNVSIGRTKVCSFQGLVQYSLKVVQAQTIACDGQWNSRALCI
jgi:hypothetical protein